MSNDELNRLNEIELPQPSAEARRRAVGAALLAFDAAQEKNAGSVPQGSGWGARLRSIAQPKRGTWIMNTRLTYGLGTAAMALLLLPLGYQLFTTTALTPLSPAPLATSQPQMVTPATPQQGADQSLTTRQVTTVPVPAGEHDAAPVAAGKPEAPADALGAVGYVDQGPQLASTTPKTSVAQPAPPAPEPLVELQSGGAQPALKRSGTAGANMAVPAAAGIASEARAARPDAVMASSSMPSFAPGPSAPPTATQPSGDQFTQFAESPVKLVAEQPVSTFSIDVDTASYSYVRSALRDGFVPEPDAVRLEELINYFSYDYPAPESAATPFQSNVSIYPTPWNPKTHLIQIGIKGYVPPATEDKPSNLVFLIDTSGSMDEPDKLPLLKRAFSLLVDQLGANDTVSIVVYAGSAGVVLEPTKATDKSKILGALQNLAAGGSTAGAEGIELAYRLAEQAKIPNGINRVILATDGDFNVGIDDPDDLKTYIKGKRDSGIFLSVLGFGQGNLGDDTMQALAQNGNGNASYIDSFREAQKVLVAEGGGTLETIAKDVKIQIEFNPAFVSEYRLVGYETRALNREDFNNDKVDAGDIGAGTTVTALYEITPAGSNGALVDPLRYGNGAAVDTRTAPVAAAAGDEIAFLKLRYKLPDEDTSKLVDLPITGAMAVDGVAAAGDDQRFAAAVAAFGQKLKGSNYGDMSWSDIRSLAQGARGADEAGYRAEFVQLVDTAALLKPDAKPAQ